VVTLLLVALVIQSCARRKLPPGGEKLIELLEPYDGAQVTTFPINFDWTSYSGAKIYRLQIFRADAPNSPFLTLASDISCYELNSPLEDGRYLWCVSISTDSSNFTIHSDTFEFTVKHRVELLFPHDGMTLNLSRVYLNWRTYPDANGYRILILKDDSIIWDRIEFNSSVKTSVPLFDGEYKWCVGVRCGDDSTFGHYSDTLKFIIRQRPLRLVSVVPTPGSARDVIAHENKLFVADNQAGVTVIDISDINNPRTISTFRWEGHWYTRRVLWDNLFGVLITGDYRGNPALSLFDISDITSPEWLSGIWIRRFTDIDSQYRGETLFVFVSDAEDGLYTISIHSRYFIQQRGEPLRALGFGFGVEVVDSIVAVGAGDGGVVLLDARFPDSVTVLSRCYTFGDANRLILDNNLLYVANGIQGLAVVDISNPLEPRLIFNSDIQSGDAQGIAIGTFDGHKYLALAVGSEGVLFYDLSTPYAPALVGQLETPYAYNVRFYDRWFLICDRDWGIVFAAKSIY